MPKVIFRPNPTPPPFVPPEPVLPKLVKIYVDQIPFSYNDQIETTAYTENIENYSTIRWYKGLSTTPEMLIFEFDEEFINTGTYAAFNSLKSLELNDKCICEINYLDFSHEIVQCQIFKLQ